MLGALFVSGKVREAGQKSGWSPARCSIGGRSREATRLAKAPEALQATAQARLMKEWSTMVMGERAADFCDDFGWRPVGEIDPTLVAETTQHPRFGAGRAWSSSSGYSLMQAPRRIYLVYTMEGAFDFTVGGETVVAEAGQMVLLDGESPTAARTLSKTARFVWYFEPTILRPGASRFRFHEPISMNRASLSPFLAVTNSVLEKDAPRGPRAQEHIGIALERLLEGALEETGTLRTRSDALHADGLFMAAQLAIDAHFRDPSFDISSLARELSARPDALRAAFAAFGTTPSREIERHRISEVDRLTAQQLTSMQIIERAGFASLQQFREADARAARPRAATADSDAGATAPR